MNRIVILAMGVVCFVQSQAQNEVDALRYSQTTFGGTARYNGMAGAFGALGGDFSTLSTNPAGIAVYRKSEISFTPSLYNQTTNSTFNGKSSSDSKLNFNLGNIGIVGTFNTQKEEGQAGWASFSFGFGYNRMANFHNRMVMEGPNSNNNSLVDIYLQNANGNSVNDLDQYAEGLAYNTAVIDSGVGGYFSNVPFKLNQRKTVETTGSMGETVLTFGGNYDNKLYLGGTVGFERLRYTENSTYSESAVEKDTVYGFESFRLNQQVTTSGSGINIKLGAIYRATDWMRLGVAFHSPTAYTMHDEYVYTMSSTYSNNSSYAPGEHSASSPNGTYDYSLVSPARVIGSVGFIVAQRGLIGIDYEYVDYTSARFSSTDGSFSDVNDQVKKKYSSAGNLRIGGEWKVAEPISLRAGYAAYGSPYKGGVNIDAGRTSYTFGIGLREKNYFIDLAYVLTQYKENYYFYDPTHVTLTPVTNSFNATSIMATFGLKF